MIETNSKGKAKEWKTIEMDGKGKIHNKRYLQGKGYPKGAVTATLPPTIRVVKSPFADCIPGLENKNYE